MLPGIAQRFSILNLSVHARHMVLTRRSVKVEANAEEVSIVQSTTVVVGVPESSSKRRKVTKSEGSTGPVNVETTAIHEAPISTELTPVKPGKRKSRPKLLQTLHTDEDLPAIKKKSAQVWDSVLGTRVVKHPATVSCAEGQNTKQDLTAMLNYSLNDLCVPIARSVSVGCSLLLILQRRNNFRRRYLRS